MITETCAKPHIRSTEKVCLKTHSSIHTALRHDAGMGIRGRIRELLNDRGVSVRGASIDAGLGQTYLRDLLDIEDRSPRLSSLEKLADYFGVSLEYIIFGTRLRDQAAAELWSQLDDTERDETIQFMEFKISHRPSEKNWATIAGPRPDRSVAEAQDKFKHGRGDGPKIRAPRKAD
jgi:transcriptional regulator with XRE-family HTH domain